MLCVAQAVGHTTDTITSAILTGKVVRLVVLGRLDVLSSFKHFDFCQQLDDFMM